MDSNIGSSLKEEDTEDAKEKSNKLSVLEESGFDTLASASTNSFNSLSSSIYNKVDSNYQSFLSTDADIRNSTMCNSLTSLMSDDDPWKASAIGIRCISNKPIGYVFLTRRILDLYSTDGKRKLEILYNYSKKYKNKIKIPTLGSSINNCCFCDTITFDLDPDSTLFDLIMEVQIITQCAEEKNNLHKKKVKMKKKEEINNLQSSSSGSESDNDNETTLVTSTYDIKYHNNEVRPDLYEVLNKMGKNSLKNWKEDDTGIFQLKNMI